MITYSSEELATQLSTTAARVDALVDEWSAQLPHQRFYVFRAPPGTSSGVNAPAAPRTVLAFVSPDDALTFAQRHNVRAGVRVRGLSVGELLRAMLATPSIGKVVFLEAWSAEVVGRNLPPATTFHREALVNKLT